MRLPAWILLGVLELSSAPVVAQPTSDRAFDNRDLQVRPGTNVNRNGWALEITLPISWTSNAVQTFGQEAAVPGPAISDWHFYPDTLLRYKYQFDWIRFSAKFDIGEDRYFHRIEVNQDAIFATLKLEFTNGRSDVFVPYVAYTPEVDFLPFFAKWQDTLQDFYGGFTSGIGFHGGKLVPYRDAIDPGDWSVLLDFHAGQRLASPKEFENTFFRVSLDIIYQATDELSFWLTPTYRVRNYPDFFGEPGHTTRVSLSAKVAWTPDWLTRRIKNAEIDFGLSWLGNFSNIPEERYLVWEIGPSVLLAWHF